MSEDERSSLKQRRASPLRAWLIWSVVSLALALYVIGGVVETRETTAKIELNPGREFEIKILRTMPNPIEFALVFDKGVVNRADPGKCCEGVRTTTSGLFVFTSLGASVQVVLSSRFAGPVLYAAQPAKHYPNTFERRMTADIVDGKPAFWERAWEVSRPQFRLHSGLNNVHVKVISVDPALVGESVQVVVDPPLSIKWVRPNNEWLIWGLFLWPIFVVIQMIWALVLIGRGWVRPRQARKVEVQQG